MSSPGARDRSSAASRQGFLTGPPGPGIRTTKAQRFVADRCQSRWDHAHSAQRSIVGFGGRPAVEGRAGRRRDWVLKAGAVSAGTPMWTTRSMWLDALRAWATPDVVRAACARAPQCSITIPTLIAVAEAMTDYADHATGRNMAATRATIAARVGCSPRTVTTAWQVLHRTGWLVLASRGHGSKGTAPVGRRPSIWHLVPRRPVQFFHLPPSGGVGLLTPDRNYSPKALPRPRTADSSSKKRPRRAAARSNRPPRPLTLQKLAAQLITQTHGLDRRTQHVGVICEAITAAQLDPSAWTAGKIKTALEADMRATGTCWPDHIRCPAAFLSSRLRRLPARPPEVPAVTPQPTGPATSQFELTAAQRSRIAALQQEIKNQLAATRQRRRVYPVSGVKGGSPDLG